MTRLGSLVPWAQVPGGGGIDGKDGHLGTPEFSLLHPSLNQTYTLPLELGIPTNLRGSPRKL